MNLGYTFDGETFGNAFTKANVSVTLKAMAVQAANLEAIDSITKYPLIAAYMIVDGFFIPESTNAVDYKTFETESVVEATTPSETIPESALGGSDTQEYRLYNFAVENVSETDTMYVYVTGADLLCIMPGNHDLTTFLINYQQGILPDGSVAGSGQGVSSFTLASGANCKFAVVTYGSTGTPPTVQIYTEPSGDLPGVKNGLVYYMLEDGTGYSVSCADSSLTEATIENTFNGLPVKEISYCGFGNQTNLQSITLPANVETIGAGAFIGCTALQSVDLGEVQEIGGQAFDGCTALQEIEIPNSVTGKLDSTFPNCTNLSKVTFEEGCQISEIYIAFENCSSLTEITIPKSVTLIDERAFGDCVNLESVYFEEGSQCKTIHWSFEGCTSLKEITIPNSVESIGNYTFQGCTSITEITIPSSVQSIWNYAFQGCTSITEITIPSSVTTIKGRAFEGCTSLINLTLNAKEGYKWQVYLSLEWVDCSTLTMEQIVEYAFEGRAFGQIVIS